MTQRVGARGQVVIPKGLRERAGLRPGTEVCFDLDGDRVIITAVRPNNVLAGRFHRSGMADELLRDRAREPR